MMGSSPDRLDDHILQEKLDHYSLDIGEHSIWCGNLDRDGYGRVWVGGRSMKASRLAWELAYGPIPPGMMVLHRNPCHHPACVRFDHLYLGTSQDNQQDRAALQLCQTHCKHGHLLDEANTKWCSLPGGRLFRRCRICCREGAQGAERRRDDTQA